MLQRLGLKVFIPFAFLVAAAPAAAQSDILLQLNSAANQRVKVDSAGGIVALGTQSNGTIPATGAGVRLMWYPGKAAFRAGTVGGTQWDDANVGLNSFAVGMSTTASGEEAVALGNGAVASGSHSLALHGNASAAGAMALGTGSQATGSDAVALGPTAVSGGTSSVAIGPSAANGSYGVAIGFQNSASGSFSVAVGKNARTAGHTGSVVISDGSSVFTADSVYPTADNQIVVRGSGGVTIYTSTNLSSGATLAAGSGSWNSLSDRNRKENFLALDPDAILDRVRDLPVTSWNYIAEGTGTRHIGPMAQDWAKAFHLSADSLTINTGDFDGVNLIAIQALERRTAEQRVQIDEQKARIDALEQRVQRLEQLVQALAQQQAPPEREAASGH